MSFIKRGLRKIWDFVKKYWKEIVLVAAVVFTAGVATIGGFAAFGTVVAEHGVIHAIGSTMWAGVTGTAGSMGIGKGAAGAAATHTGTAGMGLGGGLGWGGANAGLGVTTSEYAGNAAYHATLKAGGTKAAAKAAAKQAAANQIGNTAGLAAQKKVVAEKLAEGLTQAEADAAGTEAFRDASTEAIKEAAKQEAAGMSTGKAMLWSTGIGMAGQGLMGYAQGKALEEEAPAALWGVPIGKHGKGFDYGAVTAPYLATPGVDAPSAEEAAQEAQAEALASTRSPIMALEPSNMGGYEQESRYGYQPNFGVPRPLMGGVA